MEMSSEASQSELLLKSMAEEGDEGDAEFLATQFPDWQLIGSFREFSGTISIFYVN